MLNNPVTIYSSTGLLAPLDGAPLRVAPPSSFILKTSLHRLFFFTLLVWTVHPRPFDWLPYSFIVGTFGPAVYHTPHRAHHSLSLPQQLLLLTCLCPVIFNPALARPGAVEAAIGVKPLPLVCFCIANY